VLQLTLPLALLLALFSSDVVGLWLGPTAPPVTSAIVAVLMAAQTVTLLATPAEKVLVGTGRVRAVSGLAVIEGCSNLGVSIVLVSVYGAIGAAIGTLLTSALLAPLKLPLACRAVACSPRRFLRVSIVPALVGTLPGAVGMLLLWTSVSPGSVRLAAAIVVGIVLSSLMAAAQVGPRRTASMVYTLLRRRRLGRRSPTAEGPSLRVTKAPTRSGP
jgi:hypothetical protein